MSAPRWASAALPAAAGIAGVVAAPYVLPSFAVYLLTLTFIAALLAGSVNLLAGLAGLVSIGHAGIAAAAAYGVAWAAVHDLGIGAQLALAAALTLAVSVVYALTTMRTAGIVFLMITLALGMTVFGLALKLSGVTGGQNGLTGIRRPEAVDEWWQFYFFAAAVLGLCLLALGVVSRSPFGLVLRGIRESPSRMTSLGYSVTAAKFVAVVLSGAFAGCAGVLLVWNSEFLSPSVASFPRSALAVVTVILGGTGTLLGPLVGAGIVVAGEYWLSSYVERWQTVLGAVFILVVLFAPRGVVGTIAAWARRSRKEGS
ncbi:MAG TPA: branched-chain amino acid ABC transporter permease [Actinomycetes bacterium]|nr:branched-chain amino acid ABC transporter permease [Actinomycetes bacterium]